MTPLLIALAFAQTATYETTGERVAVFLPRLGAQLRLNLEAAKSTAADVVVVRFNDVSAKEAMDKIATTLNAEWRKEGSVTFLARTGAQERTERGAEFEETVATYKRAQA